MVAGYSVISDFLSGESETSELMQVAVRVLMQDLPNEKKKLSR